MKTPVCDFIKKYAESGLSRLHMPGHKGKGPLGCEALDITEIAGADVLYAEDGILRESEAAATALFGTERTLYSAEGSSLAIRAMLALVKKFGGESAKILAARNVHKTFLTAVALLDMDVRFICGRSDGVISCEIDPDALRALIAEEKTSAVYITSPDYLGNRAKISEISAVCREAGVLLLVDNAHGAYLKFLPESEHPIDLGADMCCDSAHKTLSALTGGAYLHISKSAPSFFSENAAEAMSLFASTSPSYLILASLDAINKRIAEGLCDELASVSEKKEKLCKKLENHGFTLTGDEPLKITISPKSFGYTGEEIALCLEAGGVICEFADRDFTSLMLSADTTDEDLEKTEAALLSCARRAPIEELPPKISVPETAMSPHSALFSPSETVAVGECEGRIFADISVSCPPAIPICICGERITREAVRNLEYYGVKSCKVVK